MVRLGKKNALGILILTAALVLGAPAFAEEAATQPSPSAEAAPEDGAACGTVQAEAGLPGVPALEMQPEPTPTTCTATAFCESGSVSCTGCPSDRQHANCPYQRGWVSCNGNVTYCPACAPAACDPPCKQVCWPTGGQCSNGQCYCY